MKAPPCLDARRVDEWLYLMNKLGFIDPKVKPMGPIGEDYQELMAKIFEAWIGTDRSIKEAKMSGAKVGNLIAERAAHNGMQLGLVWDCVRKAANFYDDLVHDLEGMVAGAPMWEGRREKISEHKVALLMLTLFIAVSKVIEHEYNNKKQDGR